jgi:Alw26I/Eco31I/Esp3I family type II restriction m6 adenine DNA methyltransferase
VILSNPFDQDEFIQFIEDFLPDFALDQRKVDPGSSGFLEVVRLGQSSSLRTSVFVIRSKKQVKNRISLTNNSFKIMKAHQIYRALVVYVNEDETIWRLSLLTALPTFNDGKVLVSYSNPRRHSYVLGSEVGIATARKYLSKMGKITDFEDLEFRFSVEAVNKDFYKEITGHFYKLVGKYGEDKEILVEPLLKLPSKKAKIEDLQNYSVRLLGRIIFLWFLRQKSSNDGNPLLSAELLNLEKSKSPNILKTNIEQLFFEVLNKPLQRREPAYQEGLYAQVPYLNGGLFHASDGEGGDFYDSTSRTSKISIPDSWFIGLFETLNTYNFTIDENLENDVDLSIDPEMLGRVFENLLAEINPETGLIARKSTGSYYTPRAIVNYMVDESLEEYLTKKTDIEVEKIRAVITTTKHDDLEYPLKEKEKLAIIEAISELRVLDPACGSGAFPIGMLQKILWVISQVDPSGDEYLESEDMEGTEHWLSTSRLDYLRKRKIIRDIIFGTDIQSVAVEIAKIRCFLTLIVDQEIDDVSPNRGVVPLPNLDFKFICADSLVPLDPDLQTSFGDDPDLESKLMRLRKKYFTTTNEEKKQKLRNEFEKLVNADPSLFKESKRNLQLKSFRPLASNNQAEFFDAKTMFGVDDFPVIIGNPPYKVLSGDDSKVILAKLKGLAEYKYATGGRLNLYRHFIERSVQLLSDGGILSFIVPSTLIADKNTRGIRQMFRDKGTLKFLIEFPEKEKVFESVTQATTIFLFNRSFDERDFYLAVGLNSANLPPVNSVSLNWGTVEDLFGPDLTLPMIKSTLELDLMKKIKNSSFPLIEISGCYEGEMNQTFQKEKIVNFDTGHIFVRGEHLSSYFVDLSTDNTDRRWFKLSENSKPSEKARFACQGVSNMGLRRRVAFARISKGIILGNSLNYIDIPKDYDPDALLALLNSSLINWYFRKQSTNNNVNVYELEGLPIRELGSIYDKKIVGLVKQIEKVASNKGYKRDKSVTSELEVLMAQIDSVIYDACGLTSNEIELVETF